MKYPPPSLARATQYFISLVVSY
ncbi:hypothetical protein CY0110_16647 [Crocosphaera chwakensis CCY0110]|uniref:Uncharacterized protein n=1 Tax=Crocosphaera chwakensis CCY0110 TaxID=391612 RepID=A3II11_9CHRO|nr:hypothetical protein CY0110_16647 [Crocosphaera chwakensis CCY0110]